MTSGSDRRAVPLVGLGGQRVVDARGRLLDVYVSYLASVRCQPLPEAVLKALASQSHRAGRASLN